MEYKEVKMIKVDTIQQFKCVEWIKENFFIEYLQIAIFDKDTLLIKDKNNAEAFVKYDKRGIELLPDLWVLGIIQDNYIVYLYSELDKVTEANHYATPVTISSFANKEEAERELMLLVNKRTTGEMHFLIKACE